MSNLFKRLRTLLDEPRSWKILLVLVLVVGFFIRLYDLTDLPLDFHPTRQLFSAIKARSIYYQFLPDAPEWQQVVAARQGPPTIEPPVMETILAWTYRLTGEKLWVARLYSSFFWVMGGLFVYKLAQELSSKHGALIALFFYLFLPYGIIASRSFQPDPLMVCLVAAALWAFYTWNTHRTLMGSITAGLLAGMAIFVKNVAVFPLLGAVLASLFWRDFRKAIKDKQVWIGTALAALPVTTFTLYGLLVSKELSSQFNLRFFPQLWLDPVFYLRWVGQTDFVVGKAFVFLAVVGFLVARPRPAAYLWGIAGGYAVYGMVFAYHITTHDYYHLPLIPIVALGLAQIAAVFYERLEAVHPGPLAKVALASLLVFVVALNIWDGIVQLKREDFRSEVTFWANLGDFLGHTEPAIGLSAYYSYSLAYWGWQDVEAWATTADLELRDLAGIEVDARRLFEQKAMGKKYFVVTAFHQLDEQPEIKALLYKSYKIVAKSPDYVIFDLTQPLPAP